MFDKITRAGAAAMLINETHFGFCIIHFLICHFAVGEQSLVVARRWPVTRLQPRIMQTGKSAFYFHLLIAEKQKQKQPPRKENSDTPATERGPEIHDEIRSLLIVIPSNDDRNFICDYPVSRHRRSLAALQLPAGECALVVSPEIPPERIASLPGYLSELKRLQSSQGVS